MAIPELNRPPRAQGLILVYGEGKLETRETPSTQSARAGPASPSLGPETRLLQTSGVRAARGNPAPGFRRPALPAGACRPPGTAPRSERPRRRPGLLSAARGFNYIHSLTKTGPCDGCRDRAACCSRLFHRKPLATGKDARLSQQGT